MIRSIRRRKPHTAQLCYSFRVVREADSVDSETERPVALEDLTHDPEEPTEMRRSTRKRRPPRWPQDAWQGDLSDDL